VGLKSPGEGFLAFERSFLVPTREKGVEERARY
jgi:itaconyl-CoA hydratase